MAIRVHLRAELRHIRVKPVSHVQSDIGIQGDHHSNVVSKGEAVTVFTTSNAIEGALGHSDLMRRFRVSYRPTWT